MKNLIFILVIILVALAVILPTPLPIRQDFRFGLDLKGGTHIVYEADLSKIPSTQVAQALAATVTNLENRTNLLGVSEAIVQSSKTNTGHRIIVELPGVTDVQSALDTIGQTAQLQFVEIKEIAATKDASASSILIPTDLTGQDLKSAQVEFNSTNQLNSGPGVAIEFTDAGAKKFADITSRNVGRQLPVLLDGQVVTAPTVNEPVTDGKAVISGSFTVESAKALSIQLSAGALPVPIKIIEQRSVGATLGNASVTQSFNAGLVGLVAIAIFMILNYRAKGFLACIALAIYILISLALFKLIPVTLTLAGIAGFILSIGMAVDANILIFERIKEEISWGRSKTTATELGFKRAWTSVRDSNASSLITASILFWFGSGSVRGFALTLMLGILVSLFTSITVTRALLRLIYERSSFLK